MHHLQSGRGEPDLRQFPHYYHYFKYMLQCLNNALDREMLRIIIQTSILHSVPKTINIKICTFPSLIVDVAFYKPNVHRKLACTLDS